MFNNVFQKRLKCLLPKFHWKRWEETLLFFQPDIDDCQSSPCENGGLCSDKLNDYACSCIQGYTGKNCATSKGGIWI